MPYTIKSHSLWVLWSCWIFYRGRMIRIGVPSYAHQTNRRDQRLLPVKERSKLKLQCLSCITMGDNHLIRRVATFSDENIIACCLDTKRVLHVKTNFLEILVSDFQMNIKAFCSINLCWSSKNMQCYYVWSLQVTLHCFGVSRNKGQTTPNFLILDRGGFNIDDDSILLKHEPQHINPTARYQQKYVI